MSTVVAACTQDASLHIRISAPQDPLLSPLDDRLALVSLQVSGPEVATQIQSRPVVRGEPLELGEVPISRDLSITLAASDGTGRLLGYGRSDAPVDVTLGSDAEVEVRVRRPFAYMIGGPALTSVDTTLDLTQAYRKDLAGTASPRAVAVPPDGKDIVLVEGTGVRLYDTATHAPVPGLAPLQVTAGAVDAMVSADSQWLVLAHATGVSVIRLTDLRAGAAQVTFLPVGNAAAIAMSGGLAWVLLDAEREACAPTPKDSSLVAVDLAGGFAGPVVSMHVAIADLTADPATQTVLATLPCANKVSIVGGSGDTPTLTDFLTGVPFASAIASVAGRVYVLGAVDAKLETNPNTGLPVSDGSAHLVLVSKNLDGSQASTIQLPIAEEAAKGLGFGLDDVPGQSAEVRMGADQVRPLDLAVLPDGSRLAVIWTGEYETVRFGDGGLLASLTLTTSEYQLLDSATGVPLQRLRTSCDGFSMSDGAVSMFACVEQPGQDSLGDPGYVPTHLAVLFGGR